MISYFVESGISLPCFYIKIKLREVYRYRVYVELWRQNFRFTVLPYFTRIIVFVCFYIKIKLRKINRYRVYVVHWQLNFQFTVLPYFIRIIVLPQSDGSKEKEISVTLSNLYGDSKRKLPIASPTRSNYAFFPKSRYRGRFPYRRW